MEIDNSNKIRPFDVFLSYSHDYRNEVENLAKHLKELAGFHIWLDKWRLIPGRPFISGMSSGMDQAKSCAVCIGARTPEGWFRAEIHKALNQQMKDETFGVIPVLLPDANDINVNEFLELNTWVNFRDNDRAYALYLLICGIKGIEPGQWNPENGRNLIMVTGNVSENVVEVETTDNIETILQDLNRFEQLGLIHSTVPKETWRQFLKNL